MSLRPNLRDLSRRSLERPKTPPIDDENSDNIKTATITRPKASPPVDNTISNNTPKVVTRPGPQPHKQIPTADGFREPILCLDVADQYFQGPERSKGPYAAISVVDPVITVERHGGKYHIAARFNIETTIQGYSTKRRSEFSRAILLSQARF
jgi:hypothetical protein